MDSFFEDSDGAGPKVTDRMLARAQAKLGVRIPEAYVAILRKQNGGTPAKRCFRTTKPTSWGPDHVEIANLIGIGTDEGLDGELGSAYMIKEWGYPDIGLVICDTPAAGPDTVMLDYSKCGPEGEPRVVYIDDDRKVLPLARTFAEFAAGLVDCAEFPVEE